MKRIRGRKQPAPDAAAIDARYGLEPVYEPGQAAAGAAPFVAVQCPYCGERYDTALDLSAGAYTTIEDCQVCCRPIELRVAVDEAGALADFVAARLD